MLPEQVVNQMFYHALIINTNILKFYYQKIVHVEQIIHSKC